MQGWRRSYPLAAMGSFKLGFCATYEGEQRTGGAVVAFNTEGVDYHQGRKDLAALWDIRVHHEFRRRGVGAMLFRWAKMWATERDCRLLKIETQNINVPAESVR